MHRRFQLRYWDALIIASAHRAGCVEVEVQGESVDGYHIFVGGGFGKNKKIGRQVFNGLTCEQTKLALETKFLAYQ